MKYIKLFEAFGEEIEVGKFCGIDISEINYFEFGWSNMPFISDYKDINGKYGTAEKRIDIGFSIEELLSGIDKEEFRKILVKNGFDDTRAQMRGYHIRVEGENVRLFFEIVQNIRSLI